MRGNLSARLNRYFIASSCLLSIVNDDFSITYNALNSKYIVMQVNNIRLWQGYQAQGAFLKRLKCPLPTILISCCSHTSHTLYISQNILIYYALDFPHAQDALTTIHKLLVEMKVKMNIRSFGATISNYNLMNVLASSMMMTLL